MLVATIKWVNAQHKEICFVLVGRLLNKNCLLNLMGLKMAMKIICRVKGVTSCLVRIHCNHYTGEVYSLWFAVLDDGVFG